MERIVERFIKKHLPEVVLYLQAERRSAEHEVLTPARAAVFFLGGEAAGEFRERHGLKEPLIEVSLGPDQKAYGALVSPALAKEIKEIPGLRHEEDRGRPKKKGEEPLPEAEGPRRITARDMEELTRLAVKSWQSVPGLRKEMPVEEPRPERVKVTGGFRHDKLMGFLERTLGKALQQEEPGHGDAPEDHGFRLPKNGGPKNGGPKNGGAHR